MKDNVISVITVSYNAVNTIEKTILSVVNQSYPKVQYIVIDGGSNDGTLDIIKKYSDKIYYWVSESDKGIYDAMNKGIDKSTGDYLLFLGADDILIVDLSAVMSYLCNSTIIYGNILKASNNELFSSHFDRFSLIRKNVPHQAIFYPKKVFQQFSYNLKYKIYADWYLNIQCVSINMRRKYIDIPITLYNDFGISGNNKDLVFLNEFDNIIFANFGRVFAFLYKIICIYRDFHKS